VSVSVARETRAEGGFVARVTIDRAAKLNALDRATLAEIIGAMTGLADDPALRLAVVTGAGGRAFIGGADINDLAALDADSARGFITAVHVCCDAFRHLPVPTIARIDGYALGAGLELAAACDFRVASDRSVFGMPEVRIGLPSVVGGAAPAADRPGAHTQAFTDRREYRRRGSAGMGPCRPDRARRRTRRRG